MQRQRAHASVPQIYTANTPYAYQNFGDVGILCARLKGECVPVGRGQTFNKDTGIAREGTDKETAILGSCSQCLPLVYFCSSIPLENKKYLLTTCKAVERVYDYQERLQRILDETIDWAKEAPNGEGGTVLDLPWVNTNLARVHAKAEALKLFNWQQAWSIAGDALSPADASAIKIYGSEAYVECSRLLMEVQGAAGCLQHSSKGTLLRGRLERYYRMSLVLTFGGGTNEIQRDIICQAGLRMPRLERRQ